jgi:hypothetical protein
MPSYFNLQSSSGIQMTLASHVSMAATTHKMMSFIDNQHIYIQSIKINTVFSQHLHCQHAINYNSLRSKPSHCPNGVSVPAAWRMQPIIASPALAFLACRAMFACKVVPDIARRAPPRPPSTNRAPPDPVTVKYYNKGNSSRGTGTGIVSSSGHQLIGGCLAVGQLLA